ncbi:hypothetical protein GPECTOR_3g482 [Gonium pectorale]|uniref:Protein kinase domain-containing protein n=1 Tax=Gonium pectorale TaxID=33097 RepID=A0A150H045_GONPE|nr:hypothetical protein GPECTOR_3g482 [Gonium pectorale]|eukprot:KXZ55352.1 hypothetical protein GPECTOR_3g482 [Gonium pectorale]
MEAAVLRSEARYLRNLDHPALLRCRDAFETKFHLVMVLEYLSGGEMLHHLHRVEHYSEAEAARLFAQVVAAVAYLHNLNIVHRDIKPENVMFARPVDEALASGSPLRVKLIDLGMAAVLLPDPERDGHDGHSGGGRGDDRAAAAAAARRPLLGGQGAAGAKKRQQQARARSPPRGCLGSPGFIAPEVINGAPHSSAMDVYSLGVLLFVMLTGRKPWPLREARSLEYARRPTAEAPGLKDRSFLSLSHAARELLLAMLADDPRRRPSAADVLRHPFIVAALRAGQAGPGAAPLGPPLDDAIKRRMLQLASLRRFRGLAFAMMSGHGEGQQSADFMAQVVQRRKALHRDLLARAKTRRAAELAAARHQHELQQRHLQQQQQRLGAGGSAAPGTPDSGPGGGRAVSTTASPASATRLSVDSSSSQQPLLLTSPQRSSHDRWRSGADAAASAGRGGGAGAAPARWSVDDQRLVRPAGLAAAVAAQRLSLESHSPSGVQLAASSPARVLHMGHSGASLAHAHHFQQQLQPIPEPKERPGAPWPAAAPSTAVTAAAGRPPLPPHLGGRVANGRTGVAVTTAADGVEGPQCGWSSSGRQESTGRLTGCGGTGAGVASSHRGQMRDSNQRQGALPGRGGGGGAGRGARGGGMRRTHHSELELAALDPLALIRELPPAAPGIGAGLDDGGGGRGNSRGGGRRAQVLGHAHSAPESLIAAEAAGFGLGPGQPAGGGGPGAGGRGGAALGPSAGSHDAAAWQDGWTAMGADMRAFSANSWTLDLLGNAELLAALTGIDLAAAADASYRGGRGSSGGDWRESVSGVGGSVYGNNLYCVGSGLSATALDAGSADPSQRGAAAAVAAAALRRLQSGLSAAASAALSDATVHAASQAAAALLAAAVAAGNGNGGGAAAVPRRLSREALPPIGLAAAVNGLSGTVSGLTGGTSRYVYRLPPGGSSGPMADTPTRSFATAAAAAPAVAAAAMVETAPSGASPCMTATTAAQPRVLFGAAATASSAFASAAALPPELFGSAALSMPGSGIGLGADGAGRASLAAADAVADAVPSWRSCDSAAAATVFAAEGATDMPRPLMRMPAARDGAAAVLPTSDVTYTSLHLTPAAARLGVALPASAAAAAASAVAAARSPGFALSGAAAASVASAATPPPARRPPSLALVHLEEQVVAARRASLEETLHGGSLWLRSGYMTDVLPVAPAAAANPATRSDRRTHAPGDSPAATAAAARGCSVKGGVCAALSGDGVLPSMPSPGLGRILEGAEGPVGSSGSGKPTCRAAAPTAGAAAASVAAPACCMASAASASAGHGGAGNSAQPVTRWRSPFEAFAAAPLVGGAAPSDCGGPTDSPLRAVGR